jgi:hypothetical protein
MGVMVHAVGFLLDNYQTVRQQIIKTNNKNTTTLLFNKTTWNNFDNKHEIFYNNDYYDVISHQQINNSIVVLAIKDSTENHFRIAINQVFKKNKKPIADKTNLFKFFKHLSNNNQNIVCTNPATVHYISHTFDKILIQKTKNYIRILRNPPC